jgi:DNA ligase-1
MNHKPMLAVDCGGIENVVFPVIASPKLDGVRAITTAEGLMSRTLKLIPNKRVQALLDGLPIGLDGELLAGDPCAPDVYRKTVSMVMSDDADITGLMYHLFDVQEDGGFIARLIRLKRVFYALENRDAVAIVPQILAARADQLTVLEQNWVKQGYEGAILRSPEGPYKHGRSTAKEGYLLKLKRFVDSEAVVIGVTELMHNGNEAKTNALGRTERSTHKANKTSMGTLGALQVRDVKTGVEFEIGTGFSAEDRKTIWSEWHDAPNAPLAKYKYFAGGSKDKPRFPVFLGWRDARDL